MSTTKRIPLSVSNPNVANSPMRALSGANGIKKARGYADMLREEPYGQPPPAKRQMIERGVPSPSRPKTTRTMAHRSATTRASTATTQRASAAPLYNPTEEELASLRTWHTQIRNRFPKMVFYFEGISDDHRSKLAKQIGRLGAVSYSRLCRICPIRQAYHLRVIARGEVFLHQHHPHRHEPVNPARETEGRTRGRDGYPRRQ
jgi:regulatory subunit for Cdc7p protein kinase